MLHKHFRYGASLCSLLFLSGFGFATTASADSLDMQNQTKLEKSKKQEATVTGGADSSHLSGIVKHFIGNKKPRDASYDQSLLDGLKGTWNISYSIGSTVETDTLTFDSVKFVDNTTGYVLYGKNQHNSRVACLLDIFTSYKYTCIQGSTLGDDYTSWYVFNKSGNSIFGGWNIANMDDGLAWFSSTPTRYLLSGTRNSTTASQTSTTANGGSALPIVTIVAPVSTTTSDTTTSGSLTPTTSDTTTQPAPPPPPAAPTATVATMVLQNGWNMISSPVNGSKIDANYLVGQGVVARWGFNAATQTYYKPDYIEPGVGYWVKAPSLSIAIPTTNIAASNSVDLTSVLANAVVSKWNILGVPMDTTIESIKTQSGSTQTVVYGYDTLAGAYTTIGALKAGSGFWYRAATASVSSSAASDYNVTMIYLTNPKQPFDVVLNARAKQYPNASENMFLKYTYDASGKKTGVSDIAYVGLNGENSLHIKLNASGQIMLITDSYGTMFFYTNWTATAVDMTQYDSSGNKVGDVVTINIPSTLTAFSLRAKDSPGWFSQVVDVAKTLKNKYDSMTPQEVLQAGSKVAAAGALITAACGGTGPVGCGIAIGVVADRAKSVYADIEKSTPPEIAPATSDKSSSCNGFGVVKCSQDDADGLQKELEEGIIKLEKPLASDMTRPTTLKDIDDYLKQKGKDLGGAIKDKIVDNPIVQKVISKIGSGQGTYLTPSGASATATTPATQQTTTPVNGGSAATYNSDGYDANGYDSSGYNADGYDKNGFNASGYNASGYNAAGYNPDGYDSSGYNASGLDKDGHPKGWTAPNNNYTSPTISTSGGKYWCLRGIAPFVITLVGDRCVQTCPLNTAFCQSNPTTSWPAMVLR